MRASGRLGPTSRLGATTSIAARCGLKQSAVATLRAVICSSALVTFIPVDIALSAPKTLKTINAKIDTQIVGSVRLTELGPEPSGPLVWCFKDKPSFVYVQNTRVMRLTFGAPAQEVMTFDRALSSRSLQCSDDGSVIAVMSTDSVDFLIRKNEKIGHYRTDYRPPKDWDSLKQMLSPDGTMMAVPFRLLHSSGDDVLSEIRLLEIDGESFSWRGKNVLYFDRGTTSVRSYDTSTGQTTTIRQFGSRDPDRKYGAHVAICGKTNFITLYWGKPNPQTAKDVSDFVVSFNGDIRLNPDPGDYSSVSVSGRPEFGCFLERFTTTMEIESTRRYLMFEDGLVKYRPPRGVGLGYGYGYNVPVAPRDCLALGERYVVDKEGRSIEAERSVVALRITRAGRCGN